MTRGGRCGVRELLSTEQLSGGGEGGGGGSWGEGERWWEGGGTGRNTTMAELEVKFRT